MSQASLGLNSCFLYLTFELFDVWTWCQDMILTLCQKMVWAHWLILHIWLMRITTLLYWSIFYSSWSLSSPALTLLYLLDSLILTLSKKTSRGGTCSLHHHQSWWEFRWSSLLCWGAKFWKIVPHPFDFLCYVYFDFIGQVQKCRKQIYFCNIVMVGHFTFGLC